MKEPTDPDVFDFEAEMMQAQKLMRVDMPNLINKIIKLYLPTKYHAAVAEQLRKELKNIALAEIDAGLETFYRTHGKEDDA